MNTMTITLAIAEEDYDPDSPNKDLPITEDAFLRLHDALSMAGFEVA